MEKISVHPLRGNERRRFFEFAKQLPERDLWGKRALILVIAFVPRRTEVLGFLIGSTSAG